MDRQEINIKSFCFLDENKNLLKNNIGDELNFLFLDMICEENLHLCSDFYEEEHYLMIGSIICNERVNENSIIWGSGFLTEGIANCFRKKPKKVLAVRGPLTREKLLKSGVACPKVYGDPALLLSSYYSPSKIKKDCKIGVIPHFRTLKNDLSDYKLLKEDSVKIISVTNYDSLSSFIDDILSCDFILSESLHGLIISESYGIPNLWIDIYLNERFKSDFKFHDFFLSIGEDRQKSVRIDKNTTIKDISTLLKTKKSQTKINTKDLMHSCPLNLLRQKNLIF